MDKSMFLPVVLSDFLVPEAIPMLIAHARVDDHVPHVPSADHGDGLNGFSDADAMDGAKHVAYECSKSAAEHKWGWIWMDGMGKGAGFSIQPAGRNCVWLLRKREKTRFVGHRVLKCVEM